MKCEACGIKCDAVDYLGVCNICGQQGKEMIKALNDGRLKSIIDVRKIKSAGYFEEEIPTVEVKRTVVSKFGLLSENVFISKMESEDLGSAIRKYLKDTAFFYVATIVVSLLIGSLLF